LPASQLAVIFSHTKSTLATSHPTVFFSNNKSTLAIASRTERIYEISAFPLIAWTIIVYDQQSTNDEHLLGMLVDANDDKKMVLLGITRSVLRQMLVECGR